MQLKALVGLALAILAFLVVLIGWYRWDSTRNRGYTFGYYAAFNRVSNSLASIPNITITQSWANADMTLEEFGFTVVTADGQPVRIHIGDDDEIRQLRGNRLDDALRREIEVQSERPRTNQPPRAVSDSK